MNPKSNEEQEKSEKRTNFMSNSFRLPKSSSFIDGFVSLFKKKQVLSWERDGKQVVNSSLDFFDENKETKQNKKNLLTLLAKSEIPMEYRAKYWLNASGALREKNTHKDYYYNLIHNYPEYIPTKGETVIEEDLHRTFPSDIFFQNEENISKLRNILLAFSRRNSTIGYCQGFNFIVGRLLKIFQKEEDSFWVFCQVIEQFLPAEFYCDLAGSIGDCAISINFLLTEESQVMKFMESKNFDIFLNNVLNKWFVTLFVQNTNIETYYCIWDMFFYFGNITLFKAVVGLIKILKSHIVKAKTFEEISNIFENKILTINEKEINKLRKFILSKDTVEMSMVKMMRQKIYPEVFKNVKTTKEYLEKSNKIECNLDFPYCLDEINECQINKAFIAKVDGDLILKEDFFDGNESIKTKREKFRLDNEKDIIEKSINKRMMLLKKINIYKDLLIERREHNCNCGYSTKEEIIENWEENEEDEKCKNVFGMETQENMNKNNLNINMQNLSFNPNSFILLGGIGGFIQKIGNSSGGRESFMLLSEIKEQKESKGLIGTIYEDNDSI